jgi:hypothetical protein
MAQDTPPSPVCAYAMLLTYVGLFPTHSLPASWAAAGLVLQHHPGLERRLRMSLDATSIYALRPDWRPLVTLGGRMRAAFCT